MNQPIDNIVALIIITVLTGCCLLFASLYLSSVKDSYLLRKHRDELADHAKKIESDNEGLRLLVRDLHSAVKELGQREIKWRDQAKRAQSDQETAKQLTNVFEDLRDLISDSLGIVIGVTSAAEGHVIWVEWAQFFRQGELKSMHFWLQNAEDPWAIRIREAMEQAGEKEDTRG